MKHSKIPRSDCVIARLANVCIRMLGRTQPPEIQAIASDILSSLVSEPGTSRILVTDGDS